MPLRVLVAAEGSRGDVEPALALAIALKSAGHDVLACGPSDFADPAARVGVSFRPSGPAARAWTNRFVTSILAGKTEAFFQAYQEEIVPQQRATLRALVPHFDLVVGAGLQFAAQAICDESRVRYGYVFYCPQFLRALSLPRSGDNPTTFFDRSDLDWRSVSPLLVAADPLLAPLPEGLALRCQQTGALRLPQPSALDPRIESFLEAGPPPVYIGFGSMPEADPEQTTTLLLSAIQQAGCRALLAEGWAGLTQRELPKGCLVIGDTPHDALFPRVGAIVHHGGAGTTQTAARAGVPQIVIPRFADQFYWGHRVRALGLGPRLIPYPQLDASGLAEAISRTLGDEAMQQRAAAFGRGMQGREGESATVRALTESLGVA